jgi:hypothetical protein
MTKTEASKRLREALATCSEAQAQDVCDILRYGAGYMPLPEGAMPHFGDAQLEASFPLDARLRDALIDLQDAVHETGSHHEVDPEWTPVRAGAWESVLATLVIEGDWAQIAETARELREDVARSAI